MRVWRGKSNNYVVFAVLIITIETTVQVNFQVWTWTDSHGKAKADVLKSRHSESKPMVNVSPLRSCGLNNHNKQKHFYLAGTQDLQEITLLHV